MAGCSCANDVLCRSPVAKFLLEGGQSQSWLLGNSIITLTTSSGAQVGGGNDLKLFYQNYD